MEIIVKDITHRVTNQKANNNYQYYIYAYLFHFKNLHK